MKVVMSADSTHEGAPARHWCAEHLGPVPVVSPAPHPAVV